MGVSSAVRDRLLGRLFESEPPCAHIRLGRHGARRIVLQGAQRACFGGYGFNWPGICPRVCDSPQRRGHVCSPRAADV